MSHGNRKRFDPTLYPVPGALSADEVERLIREARYVKPPPREAPVEERAEAVPPVAACHTFAPPPVPLNPLESRIVAALRERRCVWGDPVLGATTGSIAARLKVKPRTPERDALNLALTRLRKAGAIHFEYDRATDVEAQWWVVEVPEAAVSTA